MPIKAKIYFWFTVILGVFTAFWYIPKLDFSAYNIPVVIFLAAFAFFVEIYEIEILPRHSISVSTAIYLSVIYIGGPSLAISVALPSIFASETIMRGINLQEGSDVEFPFTKIAFNTSQVVVSVAASALVYLAVGGHSPPFTVPYDYLPPFVAFFAFILINISLVSGIVSLSEGDSFFYQLNFNLRDLHLQFFSLGVISVLIAITYSTSPWNVFLVAALLLLVNTSVRSYISLRKQAKQTFEKMMDLLSERDPYTHEHSESVGGLTEAISAELKLSPEKREDIVSAARVHDIGKLGIPDSILLKNGKLNEEEWETMKEHPEVGAEILSGLKIYRGAVDIVKHEHERWDGSGYPEGLEGEDIPLGSRIVAVADVWNALRTERPYRGPLTKEEAIEEIKDMAGIKLDPTVVEALLSIVKSRSEN